MVSIPELESEISDKAFTVIRALEQESRMEVWVTRDQSFACGVIMEKRIHSEHKVTTNRSGRRGFRGLSAHRRSRRCA